MRDLMDVIGVPIMPPPDADMAEPPTPAKLAPANERCSCDSVSCPIDS